MLKNSLFYVQEISIIEEFVMFNVNFNQFNLSRCANSQCKRLDGGSNAIIIFANIVLHLPVGS